MGSWAHFLIEMGSEMGCEQRNRRSEGLRNRCTHYANFGGPRRQLCNALNDRAGEGNE